MSTLGNADTDESLSGNAHRAAPWRDGGVYLVTGGAGGLGTLLAAEIARRAGGTRIVLTGRTELTDERARKLAELREQAPRARIDYRIMDVVDESAVHECV